MNIYIPPKYLASSKFQVPTLHHQKINQWLAFSGAYSKIS